MVGRKIAPARFVIFYSLLYSDTTYNQWTTECQWGFVRDIFYIAYVALQSHQMKQYLTDQNIYKRRSG